MKRLPGFLEKYFWDVDFSRLNKEDYTSFITERILEYGDERAIRWLFQNFTKSEIKKILKKRRNISPLSANYWSLVLEVPKNQILCLQRQFQKKPQKTWFY